MSELPFTSTAASGGGSEEVLGAFEHELAMGNTSAAVALVERALDAGAEPVSLLCEVIASAQHWVGQEWHRGVVRGPGAHRHGYLLPRPRRWRRRCREVPITKGHVMVSCAEREWHALAALVVSTGLRAHGWRVTFLGAATPAEHLFSYLYQAGPDVVAISCSVAGGASGDAPEHRIGDPGGDPVLVGGSAFGVDELRARALGATAWAANLPEGIELVERLPTTVGVKWWLCRSWFKYVFASRPWPVRCPVRPTRLALFLMTMSWPTCAPLAALAVPVADAPHLGGRHQVSIAASCPTELLQTELFPGRKVPSVTPSMWTSWPTLPGPRWPPPFTRMPRGC